jgi:microcystin-dependent protein
MGINQNQALFALLGTTYGGNGTTTFGLPNAPFWPNTLSPVGGAFPHENLQPYLAVNFCICLNGIFPSRN